MLGGNPFVSGVYVLASELATLFGQDHIWILMERWKERKQQQQQKKNFCSNNYDRVARRPAGSMGTMFVCVWLTDTQTYIALPVFGCCFFFFPSIAWSDDAQIAKQASISQESLSLSQTKPEYIKEPC